MSIHGPEEINLRWWLLGGEAADGIGALLSHEDDGKGCYWVGQHGFRYSINNLMISAAAPFKNKQNVDGGFSTLHRENRM